MYRLYNSPGTAGMAPHIVLRELAVPHEIVFLDRDAGAHKTPEYLARTRWVACRPWSTATWWCSTPHRRTWPIAIRRPAWRRRSAIRTVPASTSGDVPTNTGAGSYLMVPALIPSGWPMRRTSPTPASAWRSGWPPCSPHSTWALAGRDWLVGDRFSIADVYLFMLARWSRNLPRKARDLPHLGSASPASRTGRRCRRCSPSRG